MDIYFATGPFHVFNVINLALNENEGSMGELVILNRWEGANRIADSIEASKIFKKVYFLSGDLSSVITNYNVAGDSLSLFARIKRLFIRLFSKKYNSIKRLEALPFVNNKYDRVFFPGGGFSQLKPFYLYQVKRGASIFTFDDGIGTRTYDRICTLKIRLIELLGEKWFWHMVSGVYFYSPEAVQATFPSPLIKQLRPSLMSPEKRAYLKQIYDYQPENDTIRGFKYIYFGQAFDHLPNDLLLFKEDFSKKETILLNRLSSELDNFAIKPHPLSKNKFMGKAVMESNCPFEISCTFIDMSEKVFISPFSAALYNPKFIFDQEPYIIFVYKILGIDMKPIILGNCDFETLNHRMLIEQYRHPERIFVPETIDELFDILKKVTLLKKES